MIVTPYSFVNISYSDIMSSQILLIFYVLYCKKTIIYNAICSIINIVSGNMKLYYNLFMCLCIYIYTLCEVVPLYTDYIL